LPQDPHRGRDRPVGEADRPALCTEPEEKIAAVQRIAEIETGLQPAVGTPQLEHPARDSRRPKDRKARFGPVEIGTKPGCTQVVLGISLDRRI